MPVSLNIVTRLRKRATPRTRHLPAATSGGGNQAQPRAKFGVRQQEVPGFRC